MTIARIAVGLTITVAGLAATLPAHAAWGYNSAYIAYDRAVEARAESCSKRFPGVYPNMRPAFEAWRDKHREGIQQLAAEFWRLVERDAGSSEEFARRKAVLLEDERLQNIAEANTIATFRETRARILCDGEMSDLATLSDAVLKRALADVSGRLKDPPAPATRGSSR